MDPGDRRPDPARSGNRQPARRARLGGLRLGRPDACVRVDRQQRRHLAGAFAARRRHPPCAARVAAAGQRGAGDRGSLQPPAGDARLSRRAPRVFSRFVARGRAVPLARQFSAADRCADIRRPDRLTAGRNRAGRGGDRRGRSPDRPGRAVAAGGRARGGRCGEAPVPGAGPAGARKRAAPGRLLPRRRPRVGRAAGDDPTARFHECGLGRFDAAIARLRSAIEALRRIGAPYGVSHALHILVVRTPCAATATKRSQMRVPSSRTCIAASTGRVAAERGSGPRPTRRRRPGRPSSWATSSGSSAAPAGSSFRCWRASGTRSGRVPGPRWSRRSSPARRRRAKR